MPYPSIYQKALSEIDDVEYLDTIKIDSVQGPDFD